MVSALLIRYHNLWLLVVGRRRSKQFYECVDLMLQRIRDYGRGGGQVRPLVHVQNNLENQGLTPLQHNIAVSLVTNIR